MKRNSRSLRASMVAVALAFVSTTAGAQLKPDALTTGQPEERPTSGPDAPLLQQGPTIDDPFGPTTAPGDPFGVNFASGIPSGMRGGLGFRLGPTTVYPAIGIGMRYDDNIFQ